MMDFVEKVESAMSDVFGRPATASTDDCAHVLPEREHCAGSTGRWRSASGTARPAPDWDNDIRKAFIEAHVGTDTVEMWLSKLGALRLGAETTKTPIELDNQFDTIARHIYPTLVAGVTVCHVLLCGTILIWWFGLSFGLQCGSAPPLIECHCGHLSSPLISIVLPLFAMVLFAHFSS